ncbi:hypothetical protein [Exiguobacterium sp.]|uniref:hypothetical protein n=1 Tax=Exiguobacterium sp. TaxID=44751 RepID=UPI00263AFBEE|nr:hypothetical protein [Exiguobacterium sp.]MCC5892523.1 hypothetical protein [Exiguobacterium sp.]
MRFHTYERWRSVFRTAALLLILFIGFELAFQGTTDYMTGFPEASPNWLPEAWTTNRMLVLYLGVLAVLIVDLVVSSVIYQKLASAPYVRRFAGLQLLGVLLLTSAYLVAEQIEARWPFTFIVAFSMMMYLGLTEKYLKPLQPTKQEDLPNQG